MGRSRRRRSRSRDGGDRSRGEKQPNRFKREDGDGGEVQTGTIDRSRDTFGFIRPDGGGDNLFVMRGDCKGFNGRIPERGTRVKYTVCVDPQKGKPKASNVHPADDDRGRSRSRSRR